MSATLTAKPLHELSIAEAGAALRAGEVTATALAGDALARIAALDGALNSFITVTAERALADADTEAQRLIIGGFNVEDDYFGTPAQAAWRDLGLLVEGPAAGRLAGAVAHHRQRARPRPGAAAMLHRQPAPARPHRTRTPDRHSAPLRHAAGRHPGGGGARRHHHAPWC